MILVSKFVLFLISIWQRLVILSVEFIFLLFGNVKYNYIVNFNYIFFFTILEFEIIIFLFFSCIIINIIINNFIISPPGLHRICNPGLLIRPSGETLFLRVNWSRTLSQIVICLLPMIQKSFGISSWSLAEKLVITG